MHSPGSRVYGVYVSTRDRILRLTRRLFDQKGIEAVSLRNVADKAGITAMAIYRHFENKDALIDALVLDGLEEWSARVEALPPCAGLAKIEQIGEAFLEFALKEPRRFEAAFLLPSRVARRYPDDFIAGRSTAGNIQLEAIEQAIEEGRLKADSAIEVMMTNAALSQGLITLYRAGRIAGGEEEFRALYRRAMRRSMKSFLSENAT